MFYRTSLNSSKVDFSETHEFKGILYVHMRQVQKYNYIDVILTE